MDRDSLQYFRTVQADLPVPVDFDRVLRRSPPQYPRPRLGVSKGRWRFPVVVQEERILSVLRCSHFRSPKSEHLPTEKSWGEVEETSSD